MTALAPLSEPQDRFSGRGWVFERVHTWMTQPNPCRYFLLTGAPGSGKTTIARRLTEVARGALPLPADTAGRPLAAFTSGFLSAEHFCSARDSVSFDPRNFANSLAGQLALRHTEYALALKDVGDIQTVIEGQAHVGTAQAGALVTGVLVEALNLNLSGLKPQAAFNRTVRDPLTKLYEQGFSRPITILVDALDESLLYRDDTTIVDLLARLDSLPPLVRFLLTSRHDGDVRDEFPQAEELYISDPQFDGDNRTDVAGYVRDRLAFDPQLLALTTLTSERRNELANTIADRADGNFLYVRFLLDSMAKGQRSLDDLQGLPAGLDALYYDSLGRVVGQSGKDWRRDYAPLMGVLSVAKESLRRTQIETFTEQTESQVWVALGDLEQFVETVPLVGAGSDHEERYRLYHQSFIDFLRRPYIDPGRRQNRYLLPEREWHQRIAARYFQGGVDAWKKWDDYGLRAIAAHLAGAAQGSNGHEWTERLVRLLADQRFQDRYLQRLKDLPSLRRDLEQALRSAAADTDADGYLLTVDAGLSAVSFLRDRLKPDKVFALARAGDLKAAERELGLFAVEPEWRHAVLLTAAWSTAEGQRAAAPSAEVTRRLQAARRVRDRLRSDLPVDGPLALLAAHLDAATDGAPLVLPPLPEPPTEGEVRAMIERVGGAGTPDTEALMASGLHLCFNGWESSDENWTSNTPLYVAEQDGPPLVAYVAAGRARGTEYFSEYVGVHASNGYIRYRNRSLGFLLEASLRRTDQTWGLATATHLTSATLASGRPEFQESLSLMLLGLRARLPDAVARQKLEAIRDQTLAETADLAPGRELGDAWGVYKRRLAALAQVYFVLGDLGGMHQLLVSASRVPFGFAGFQTTACLALIDTMQVCGHNPFSVPGVMQSPRGAAHNIQDHVFCAQMTARVNAIQQRWWRDPSGGFSAADVIPRFVARPVAAEFAPLHIVNDSYQFRSTGPNSVPLPSSLGQANTLRLLAAAHRRPLEDFLRLNDASGWGPDQALPPGTPVPVPDPEFPAWLAARFSAQAAADPTLSPQARVLLIQSLAPIAAAHAPSLDAICARLLAAARPADPEQLDPLLAAAARALAGPAGLAVDVRD